MVAALRLLGLFLVAVFFLAAGFRAVVFLRAAGFLALVFLRVAGFLVLVFLRAVVFVRAAGLRVVDFLEVVPAELRLAPARAALRFTSSPASATFCCPTRSSSSTTVPTTRWAASVERTLRPVFAIDFLMATRTSLFW